MLTNANVWEVNFDQFSGQFRQISTFSKSTLFATFEICSHHTASRMYQIVYLSSLVSQDRAQRFAGQQSRIPNAMSRAESSDSDDDSGFSWRLLVHIALEVLGVIYLLRIMFSGRRNTSSQNIQNTTPLPALEDHHRFYVGATSSNIAQAKQAARSKAPPCFDKAGHESRTCHHLLTHEIQFVLKVHSVRKDCKQRKHD